MTKISEISGIGIDTAEKLRTLNIIDTKDIRHTPPEDLVKVLGIGVSKITKMYAVAGIPLDSEKIATLNRMTKNKKIENAQFAASRDIKINPSPTDDYSDKHLALANFLEEKDPSEIIESSYDESQFEWGNEEYLVLTDSEADEKALESAKNLLDDVGLTGLSESAFQWALDNAVDTDWFEDAEREMSEGYARDIINENSSDEDLYINRLHEEMVQEYIVEELDLPEEPNEDDYDDETYDEAYDEWVADCGEIKSNMENEVEENIDEFVDARQSNDSVEYFKFNFGDEYFEDVITKHNLIDEDEVAQMIIDEDGRAMQLAGYDFEENEEEYNDEHYYIFRTN